MIRTAFVPMDDAISNNLFKKLMENEEQRHEFVKAHIVSSKLQTISFVYIHISYGQTVLVISSCMPRRYNSLGIPSFTLSLSVYAVGLQTSVHEEMSLHMILEALAISIRAVYKTHPELQQPFSYKNG